MVQCCVQGADCTASPDMVFTVLCPRGLLYRMTLCLYEYLLVTDVGRIAVSTHLVADCGAVLCPKGPPASHDVVPVRVDVGG